MRRRTALTLPLALALPGAVLTQALPGAAFAQRAPPGGTDAMRAAGRQAIAAAAAQRWEEAEAAARSADPLIRKVVGWMRLQYRSSGAGAGEIIGFALANPDWPGQEALGLRAEEALADDPDDGLAFEFFAAHAPRGLAGYQRLADALARAGRAEQAARVIRTGWQDAPADPAAEAGFLDRNATQLTPEHHWQRFDRLALAQQSAAAGRVLPYLDPARQGIAAGRLAYAAGGTDADAPALAAAAAADAGLTFERARWLRRQDRDAEAVAAWGGGPAGSPELSLAAWPERHILARRMLRSGDPRSAYALVSRHGIEDASGPRQDAEFLAGFIALRLLEQPAVAERHFITVADGSRSVITRARALYWQGRALAARGEAAARQRYAAAAEFPLAFYGQLAALALGEDGATLSARIASIPAPSTTTREAAEFGRKELAQVVLALAAIGETRRARLFMLRLQDLADDHGEKALAARLGTRIGRPDHAVWVVRRAGATGLMLLDEGWPAPYPAPPPGTSGGPEPALINAITRQESNFDPEAVSSANARGLMQLLPGTAQQVARRLGLRHATAMLTNDPEHNMRLGAAYLDQLLERFGGALPFAIAGYNAGPRRVDEWLGANGDPRNGGPPMLDWMELIPFGETRNYVQRVIENIAIYRARDPRSAAMEHPMTRWLSA